MRNETITAMADRISALEQAMHDILVYVRPHEDQAIENLFRIVRKRAVSALGDGFRGPKQ